MLASYNKALATACIGHANPKTIIAIYLIDTHQLRELTYLFYAWSFN